MAIGGRRLAGVRHSWPAQRYLLIKVGIGPRSAEIVGARLGLRTGATETRVAIAHEHRVSRERVRQIERKELARIARLPNAREVEIEQPEILVRLRLLQLRQRHHWSARKGVLQRLGVDAREQEILARRLALRGGTAESFRSIGARAGLSGERIRQIWRRLVDELSSGWRAAELAAHDPELLWIVRRSEGREGIEPPQPKGG